MSKPAIQVENFIPGGILATDHLHVGTHDGTCSRCRRKFARDETPLAFWANAGQHLWMYCNSCDWSATEYQRPN